MLLWDRFLSRVNRWFDRQVAASIRDGAAARLAPGTSPGYDFSQDVTFPHCDMRVLHAPGECHYCDGHADWQQLREDWGVNFTGHDDPTKLPCPAEVRRPYDVISLWPGNQPRPDGIPAGDIW